MAHLMPSDVSALSLSLGETAELRTLSLLRRSLPADYTVYHGVHWSRDGTAGTLFGEADFVVVNRAGEALVMEMKSGRLEETRAGLEKRYVDGRKNVAVQIHRTLDGLRRQFKAQTGHDLALDYLVYCPDHRVQDLAAAGLVASRIVDAPQAGHLADRVMACLAPGEPGPMAARVARFFENALALVPDIHAHVREGERTMTRLTGGLAEVVSAIEMKPLRLRVIGTAGCGKSLVASRMAAGAVASGKRTLLLCFNRPLAERLKLAAPSGALVATFYGFCDRFLASLGQTLDYSRIGEPLFWQEVQDRVIAEAVPSDWCFDTVIVDEGQDFEPEWIEILRLFLAPAGDLLWLEDPAQSLRRVASADEEDPYAARLGSGLVGYRARANYRSPELIANYIRRVLPFDFKPANPLPGLGVGVEAYADHADMERRIAQIIAELVRQGFAHGDIVVLSLKGVRSATLGRAAAVGRYSLARPTEAYDLLGNQIYTEGQIRFETVRRFKGQQAPAVIVTDIDLGGDSPALAERLLFSAMTRATVRLELLVQKGSAAAARLVAPH